MAHELQTTLGVTFSVDALARIGNSACEKCFTRKHSFAKLANLDEEMGDKPVIWCYTPDSDPMPILRTLVRYITKTADATAYILSANRMGSASHAFLEKFPVCHTFPAGSSLFALPVHQKEETMFLPTLRTDMVHSVYKILHDPTSVITAKLCKMSMNQAQYNFNVRIGRVSVKASSTYTSHILTEEELVDLEKDFMGTRHKLALGDTGATHSLITSQTAHQIKAQNDISERGHVILGDNVSTINLLGTCEFTLRLGHHVSTMKAYVIDADWGNSQHIVIGSDWISANQAMLGERDGKGPQLTVGNYTIYAKIGKEAARFLNNLGDVAAADRYACRDTFVRIVRQELS